jgi:hypothetical protein
MYVPFEELAEDARIWIYPSDTPFKEEDMESVEQRLKDFINQWTVHNKALKASFLVPYRRFVVLAVDTAFNQVSGCSIDSSVRFIQELEHEFSKVLLDKMNVTFKQGEYLAYKDLKDFKALVKSKSVSPETIVFNNLITTKSEMDSHWEVPAKESWHQRYF